MNVRLLMKKTRLHQLLQGKPSYRLDHCFTVAKLFVPIGAEIENGSTSSYKDRPHSLLLSSFWPEALWLVAQLAVSQQPAISAETVTTDRIEPYYAATTVGVCFIICHSIAPVLAGANRRLHSLTWGGSLFWTQKSLPDVLNPQEIIGRDLSH